MTNLKSWKISKFKLDIYVFIIEIYGLSRVENTNKGEKAELDAINL
jgi:hypothetical protein